MDACYSLASCNDSLALQLSLSTPQSPSTRCMTKATVAVLSCRCSGGALLSSTAWDARRWGNMWRLMQSVHLRSVPHMTKTAQCKTDKTLANKAVDISTPVVCNNDGPLLSMDSWVHAQHPSAPTLESPLERATRSAVGLKGSTALNRSLLVHAPSSFNAQLQSQHRADATLCALLRWPSYVALRGLCN